MKVRPQPCVAQTDLFQGAVVVVVVELDVPGCTVIWAADGG
jgi:hypothetical protein